MAIAGRNFDIIMAGAVVAARLAIADTTIMPMDCRANTHFTCTVNGEEVAGR